MFEKAEGTLQNIAGQVQDAVGEAAGDTTMQLEGKARQAAGAAKQTYGDAVESLRECAFTHPLATIAGSVGVGFLLGALWAKR